MIVKIPKISPAQARMLASLWVGQYPCAISEEWNDPTTLALDKRGLIEPTGEIGRYASGMAFKHYRMSLLGKGALADFLWKQYTKERDAE